MGTRGLLALSLAVALGACGGGDDDAQTDGPPVGDGGQGRYLPLAMGATWTYRVTDPVSGAVANKSSTVEAYEDIGGDKAGTMGFRVRTEKLDGRTVSWQADTGTSIVRHREQTFDLAGAMIAEEYYTPFKLRVDESPAHLMMGAAWTEAFTEKHTDMATGTTTTMKMDAWTVEAVAESVTVPAGTFSCVRLHRVGQAMGQSDKTYWFARGVGKVKETGGQTEELVSYSIP